MIRETGLYLIGPPAGSRIEEFPQTLEEALRANGETVAFLQIRLKQASQETIRRCVQTTLPITQKHGILLLLNDDPKTAKDTNTDGVHLGQTDAKIQEARRILGPRKIIGITCHADLALAQTAEQAGADYVAFGAFHPSRSKPEAPATAAPRLLAQWKRQSDLPAAAIGGITPDNALPLLQAGANFLAVADGIWGYHAGPAEAVRKFARLFRRHSQPSGEKQKP